MNTPSSGNNLPHRRTPETLSLQRSTSQDSRATVLSPSGQSPINNFSPSHESAASTTSPVSPRNWASSNARQVPSPPSAQHLRHSSVPDQRQQPMIGPSTTYYDSEQALAAAQETADYQRWVEAYGTGQPQSNYSGSHQVQGGMSSQYPQQRQQRQQVPQYQPVPSSRVLAPATEPAPLQNQYQFVSTSGQYGQPSAGLDHHYLSTPGRQGAQTINSGSSVRSGGSDYHSAYSHPQTHGDPSHSGVGYNQPSQQQNTSNDAYYYSGGLGGGDQTQSYGFTSSGGQTQPVQYTSPTDTTFTGAGDLHTLPPHTSVSPPWNEEHLPAGYGAGSSSTQPQRGGPPAGKKERVPAKKPAPTRKRPRKSGGGDSESDSDEDNFENIHASSRGPNNMPQRLPGACTHCKKLKMKCDFPKDENTCKRCKAGGHQCIVEGRKPRTAPNKREYLLAQIRQKDTIIESLLKQLHNPYLATPLSIASYRMATSPSDQNNRNIIAWLDRLQASVRTAGANGGDRAFKLDSRPRHDDDSDSGSDVPDDEYENGDDDPRDNEKMQNLPDATVPLGLIANLSLSNPKAKAASQNGDPTSTDTLDDDNVGVANETYFMPGPATDLGMRAMLIEQHSPPEILVHGLVAPEDVDQLFEIFYQRINAFIGLLDPDIHTPASTFARCPFLFTVVCAVASRYYTEKSEIYPIAMHFAKHAAANALIDGWKSVELCQAYILMSIYAVPAKRWEEDRSWLYTGLAIRIATDLNLHQVSTVKPTSERQEREMLNRSRVWLICFNLDRSTATQFGKTSTIKEDYNVRNSADWYKKSPYNHKYDVHLCAYTAMLRIVAAFHDDVFSDPSTPSGLNKNIDFRSVTLAHDANLTAYHEEWTRRFKEDSNPNDRGSAFRCTLLPFLTNYSRLVMFSFGFQQAYQRGFQHGDEIFFTKCFDAAKAVIKNFIEVLAPSGYMRYSADGHFIFSSFASAFLLKLLRPEFSNLMTKELETEIFDLIGRLIQTFSSSDIAIDDRHTPKLYARFLAGMLTRNRKDGSTVGRHNPQHPPQSEIAHAASAGYNNMANPGSSNPSFAVTPPDGEAQPGQDGGFMQAAFNPAIDKTGNPIYRPETAYTLGSDPTALGGSGPIGQLGSTPSGFQTDDEMLATMKALNNPQWWSTMMMPGFSWPDSPMMNGTQNLDTAIYTQNVPGLHHQGFGAYQPAEVPLH